MSHSSHNKNIHTLNTIDEMLVNLKVISKIKKGDKLMIEDDLLKIDDGGLFQGLARWYNSASRNETIDKINFVMEGVFTFIDKTLKDEVTHNHDRNADSILKEDNSEILQKFLLHLSNDVEGLENLKITYLGDESANSKLNVIIDKIKVKIEKINQILRIHV